MSTDRLTEEPSEKTDPPPPAPADASSTGAIADNPGVAARRCLMCARWIDDARLEEEPDEVLCVEHRSELTRSRPS